MGIIDFIKMSTDPTKPKTYLETHMTVASDWIDKNQLMLYISLAYVVIWLVGGLILMFYVRSKYTAGDPDQTYYGNLSFGLCFLLTFMCWLLWWIMYIAQLNP